MAVNLFLVKQPYNVPDNDIQENKSYADSTVSEAITNDIS